MSAHAYTDDQLVEQPAIELMPALEETFGATDTLLRETKSEVVLVCWLRAASERLNPALLPGAITAALDELSHDGSAMSQFPGQVALATAEQNVQNTESK
jgi:type I restriction enzyme, R subunit